MKKLYEFAESFCISIFLVTVIMLFVFRVVTVEGSSMYNTLSENDRIIITDMFYTPEKGDIIVTDSSNGLSKPLVKRIIATGGDTIRISYKTGEVFVNNQLLSENYILEPMKTEEKDDLVMTIDDGYVFLMGDNRNVSWDSRSEVVGQINENEILGKVVFRILPGTGKVK